MGEKLKLTTILRERIVTIYGQGALVFNSAIDFKSELKLWLTADLSEIVLDLENVTQIDSAGLGLIAQTLNETGTRGLAFRVINTPPAILATFELTGLSAKLAKRSNAQP